MHGFLKAHFPKNGVRKIIILSKIVILGLKDIVINGIVFLHDEKLRF